MPLPIDDLWDDPWTTAERPMASFAPLHTGQFIIKPRSLRRQRTLVAAIVLLIVLLPYVTYELGRARAGYSVVASQRARLTQAARINTLQTELADLRRQLGSAQVGRKVDQQSSDSMQQSFAGLQAMLQKQQEELAFYKAIVTPAAGASSEPQVQRVEVQPDAVAGRYRLLLVLIQPMQASANVQGTLQVRVMGMRQGQSVSLDLQDLLVDKSTAALKFGYRYFQNLEQLIELPADFQPLTVQVVLHAAQHAEQRQEFAWQVRPI